MTHEEMMDIPIGDIYWKCGEDKDGVIFDGGCGKDVFFTEAYRCTDCQSFFHRDCADRHFGNLTADEKRKALKLDEWYPQIDAVVKNKKKANYLKGLIYELLTFVREEALNEARK